jgi:hypothetical protein
MVHAVLLAGGVPAAIPMCIAALLAFVCTAVLLATSVLVVSASTSWVVVLLIVELRLCPMAGIQMGNTSLHFVVMMSPILVFSFCFGP